MDIDMNIMSFSSNGRDASGEEAVFPIFDRLENGSPKFLGTGFFISNNGIFITAKHVLEDAMAPYIVQILADGDCVIRGVAQFDMTHSGDLCIGILLEARAKETNNLLTNKMLKLSFYVPNKVEVISTYAYPETTVESVGEGEEMVTRMNIWAHQYHGVVVEVRPEGAGLVHEDALVCSIDSIPGNSGGPVFSPNSNGGVIGVNSSGMRGVYHVVSLIKGIMDLKLDNIKLSIESIPRTVTVREFIKLGYIGVR